MRSSAFHFLLIAMLTMTTVGLCCIKRTCVIRIITDDGHVIEEVIYKW